MRWGKLGAAAAVVGAIIVIGSIFLSIERILPESGRPGSADDPIVTKSYVDEQIRRALSGETVGESGSGMSALNARIAELEARINELEKQLEKAKAEVPYTVIRLKAGHMLLGEMGTEIVVRTGRAYVHSNPENGIPDLTDGVDLKADTLVPNNHLLMVPREGRGIKVMPDYPNDVYVTVKGEFVEIDAEGNVVSK